jgi:uncharacterized membrane protein (UPF0127 family)
MTRPHRWAAAALTLLGPASLGGCEDPPACVEDARAQVLDERILVTLDGVTVEAELADDPVERERGWMHRRCDREALLLTLPEPGPLPIWGCALSSAIDAVFVADAVIVAIERVEPCPEPCGACPITGEGLEVAAVLELPAGGAEPFELGDPMQW